jgi:prevent-host-death family protein
MDVIDDYVPVTKAKATLLDIMRRIERSDENIAITKNGVPEAVIMSMRRFRGMIETLDLLSDEKAMKSLRKSMREAREGKWVSSDRVFGA